MKLQAITLVVVFSGFFTSTFADAGDFNFGDAVRTVQKINRVVNGHRNGGGNPWQGGGNSGHVKPLPHPGDGKPVICPPPIHKPICKPRPPICKPEPPVCPPICVDPPVSHCPPPVNRPPVKCFIMTLLNQAGAEVFYNLNHSEEYTRMEADDHQQIKSHTPEHHRIQYHNGHEVVEFELDPSATYGFEWQGETLVLLEIQA